MRSNNRIYLKIIGCFSQHWGDLLFCLVLFVLVVQIGLNATVSGPGINPDAVNYISMGDNFWHGRGFVSNLASAFNPQAQPPVTFWPPGYSLLIAAAMSVGLSAIQAARLVSVGSFGLLVVGVYWLGYLVGKRYVAVLAGISVAVMMPMARLASFALSESVFTLVSVFGMIGLLKFTRSIGVAQWGWLVMAGLMIAFSILTRYVGVIWLGMGLVAIWGVVGLNWKRGSWFLLGFGAFTILPILPWFVRNLLLVGHSTGMNRIGTDKSTPNVDFALFLKTLALDILPSLHLGLRQWAQIVPLYVWLLLPLAGLIALVGLWRAGKLRWSSFHLQTARVKNGATAIEWGNLLVVIMAGLSYLAGMLVLSQVILVPHYDWPRYLAPAYPFLLITWSAVWVAMVAAVVHARAWKGWLAVTLPALLWLLPYSVQTAGFVEAASQGQLLTTLAWRQNQTVQFIGELATEEDVIFSDKPYAISLYLQRPVRYLPEHNEVDQFISRYVEADVTATNYYVVVFTGEFGWGDPYFATRLETADIVALAAKNPLFQPLATLNDGIIYRLGRITASQTAITP